MRKAVYTGILATTISLFLSACATGSYQTYSRDIFNGKRLFEKKQYAEAQKAFQDAIFAMRDSVSLTYMAVIEYKMGNLEKAEKWIGEAEKEKPDTLCYFRTFGYRALIYLKRDKKKGVAALKDYVARYDNTYPLESIEDIKDMLASGNIDESRLEKVIDDQVSWYEKEMDQFLTSHTGFFARDARSIESAGGGR